MGLCKRAKTLCYSGRLAPSPDAGSLPLLLMIMKLVCVCAMMIRRRFRPRLLSVYDGADRRAFPRSTTGLRLGRGSRKGHPGRAAELRNLRLNRA